MRKRWGKEKGKVELEGRNERNGGMGEGKERWRKTKGEMKSEEKAENKKETKRNSAAEN